MALNRQPTSIQVNGAALLLKGSTEDGALSSWQRVPGIANWTLPDETGGTNETQLMDGSVAFAQIAGVGTVSGSIGAVTAHPTHEFLAAKRRDGASIQAVIVRPAEAVAAATGTISATITGTVEGPNSLVSLVREGMLFAFGDGAAFEDKFIDHTGKAATANDDHFRAVLKVMGPQTSATLFTVSPGFSAGVTGGGDEQYALRKAGIRYGPFTCTVNGFGDGDFQAGSAMSANLSLQPDGTLSRISEHRLLADLASDSEFGSVFSDIAAI